ncbi:MAG: WbuC family cupin fold metalloprotein [Formivibrio sp.]|nr:WbuC family cupin fold metalloprotein [Formivibrio sp.]
MKQISKQDLQTLSQTAQHSPRLRANLNLHLHLDDPIQRLAIAMEPGTYVRPHRHPHTWELLYPLSGRFLVLYFDDEGSVVERTILGEDCTVLENPAGTWHAVLSLDAGGVIFEVKHGPYTPITAQDYSAWSPAEGEVGADTLLTWYATAKIGEKFPHR